ncbi:MAG TPA: cyclase family protein [Nitrososphaeraceae archaeon]|jgi:kynurenine formamidase|nr:cyclase family protein [Nitrososphaeraceae archaeon]
MKAIDLTLGISADTKVFPGSPQPSFIKWSKFDVHGYDSEVMFLSTHTGTHMDAPSHFISGAATIDKIEIDRFVCNNALLLKIEKKSNQTISLDDIIVGEEIKEKDTIVFFTRWESQIEKDNYISENPGLSTDAAEYLVEKKVNAVAIDTPSIDPGIDASFKAHKILLSNDILVIENLCNLEKFNTGRFTLIITPLKLISASGSPVRAIGIQ